MDATRFDYALANALNDPSQEIYSSALRADATTRAVLEYSRYEPCLRRYGTGSVATPAKSGQNKIVIMGGPFVAGDKINIEPGTPNYEQITVQSVAPYAPINMMPSQASEITASANLTITHQPGSYCAKPVVGLSLVASQDTYLLPQDFIRLDQASFNIATGIQLSYRRGVGFYDAVYDISNALSGVGYGSSQGFFASNSRQYPIAGNPFANPNGGSTAQSFAGGTVFRFIMSAQPMLIVSPAPTAAKTLDFFYYASHSIASVPDSELDVILAYARYSALSSQAAILAGLVDYEEEGASESGSGNARALNELAQQALSDFDTKIRCKPYFASG